MEKNKITQGLKKKNVNLRSKASTAGPQNQNRKGEKTKKMGRFSMYTYAVLPVACSLSDGKVPAGASTLSTEIDLCVRPMGKNIRLLHTKMGQFNVHISPLACRQVRGRPERANGPCLVPVGRFLFRLFH